LFCAPGPWRTVGSSKGVVSEAHTVVFHVSHAVASIACRYASRLGKAVGLNARNKSNIFGIVPSRIIQRLRKAFLFQLFKPS